MLHAVCDQHLDGQTITTGQCLRSGLTTPLIGTYKACLDNLILPDKTVYVAPPQRRSFLPVIWSLTAEIWVASQSALCHHRAGRLYR